jgi:4-aminobutyrate aminotransferase-like enzyme
MEIRPHLFSEEEISRLLSEITEGEVREAESTSLTTFEDIIFLEGTPGGAVVRDVNGKEYIDCTAQAWTLNVGYCQPDVIFAASFQASLLNHVRYSWPTIPRLKLINKLREIFPLDRVVLNTQGGGWAIETAMKLAMINKKDAEIFLTAWRGYHGNSLATTSASHPLTTLIRYKPFGIDRFVRFPYPYCYRCPFGLSYPECSLRCIDVLENTIKRGGWGKYAGLIIEPIQGPGGHIPAPIEYLKALRELTDKYDIYLIFDESQTAFGRVGAWCAAELYNVTPDMMTFTKGLGGGYPIGATLAREDIKGLTYPEEHTTFGGNPVIYAAALVNIMVIEKLDLIKEARDKGLYATRRLREIMERSEIIGDVRGPGLFIGIDIVEDKDDKTPSPELASEIVDRALEKGAIFALDMPDVYGDEFSFMNTIKFKPPLTISYEEIDRALHILEESIIEVSIEYEYEYRRR